MVIRKEQESALGRPASQPDGNMELNTQEGVPTQSASSSEPPRSIPAQILNPLQILAIQILSTFPIRGLIINLEDPQNMADTDGEPVENATSSN
uniref:Uncharacterized protein n=1 Tax=Caenorhabditis tropicalis TaxID=1561998 RepID=A0A1I7TN37_9PELO